MSRERRLSDDRVRRVRAACQLLHRARRRSAADLVRHLTGLQAQVVSAAGMALRARTEGLTAGAVDAARLGERSVVLTWAMRGTLHLVAAEDHGWLVPLVTEPRLANARRRLRDEGVPADRSEKAVPLIGRILDREGPLTRTELAERLRRRGIRTEGQAMAHLVWLAAAVGLICYGPDRGAEPCLVLTEDWLGHGSSGEPGDPLAELATRHLAAHGPAEPADLAAWAGIRLGDARRAWRSIEDRLVPVQTRRGARWSLGPPADPAPRGQVRLLPAFDEYLLGWKDRALVVPPEHRREINPGGGWIYPVLLVDGRAAGTWRLDRARRPPRLDLRPFTTLPPSARRGVVAETDDLAAFLGASISLGTTGPMS